MTHSRSAGSTFTLPILFFVLPGLLLSAVCVNKDSRQDELHRTDSYCHFIGISTTSSLCFVNSSYYLDGLLQHKLKPKLIVMDQKTISWVSYVTIIGWIIALVSYNSSVDKSSLARFHLRQSLGLFLTGFAIWIIAFMAFFIVGFLAIVFNLFYLVLVVFWILGLVSAVNGEEKPVPLLGETYQRMLTFIN